MTRAQSRRQARWVDTVDCGSSSSRVRSTTRASDSARLRTMASRVGSASDRKRATAGFNLTGVAIIDIDRLYRAALGGLAPQLTERDGARPKPDSKLCRVEAGNVIEQTPQGP